MQTFWTKRSKTTQLQGGRELEGYLPYEQIWREKRMIILIDIILKHLIKLNSRSWRKEPLDNGEYKEIP